MAKTSNPSEPSDNGTDFGGQKAKDLAAASNILPDEHANSTAHKSPDDKIVGSEFSGLENDLVNLAGLHDQPSNQDDGIGPEEEDEDQPGLPSNPDVDETSAGGLKFPDEKNGR